jgi:hypothetical protein
VFVSSLIQCQCERWSTHTKFGGVGDAVDGWWEGVQHGIGGRGTVWKIMDYLLTRLSFDFITHFVIWILGARISDVR